MTFVPVEATGDEDDEVEDPRKTDTDTTTASDVESSPTSSEAIAGARLDSLKKLQGDSKSCPDEPNESSSAKSEKSKTQNPWTRIGNVIPEAVIVLKEERVRSTTSHFWVHNSHQKFQAATFHDFLKFVYPQ